MAGRDALRRSGRPGRRRPGAANRLRHLLRNAGPARRRTSSDGGSGVDAGPAARGPGVAAHPGGGPDGRPFLRLDPAGPSRTRRASSFRDNPDFLDLASGKTGWVRIAAPGRLRWLDPRLQYSADRPPEVVERGGRQAELGRWEIPLTVDGAPPPAARHAVLDPGGAAVPQRTARTSRGCRLPPPARWARGRSCSRSVEAELDQALRDPAVGGDRRAAGAHVRVAAEVALKICSAVRVASAWVVSVGFGPPRALASAELSATNSRFTTRASACASSTESRAVRAHPHRRLDVQDQRRPVEPVDLRRARRAQQLRRPAGEELAVGERARAALALAELDLRRPGRARRAAGSRQGHAVLRPRRRRR